MQPSTPTSPYGVPQNLNQSAAREVPQRSSRYEAAAAEFGFMTDPAHIRRCMRSLTPGAGLRRLPSPYPQFPPRGQKSGQILRSPNTISRAAVLQTSAAAAVASCRACAAAALHATRLPAAAAASLRAQWHCGRGGSARAPYACTSARVDAALQDVRSRKPHDPQLQSSAQPQLSE